MNTGIRFEAGNVQSMDYALILASRASESGYTHLAITGRDGL
jgi:hypothetical protein